MSLSGNFFMEVTSTGRLSLIFFPSIFFSLLLLSVVDRDLWLTLLAGNSRCFISRPLSIRHRAPFSPPPRVSPSPTLRLSICHLTCLCPPPRISPFATARFAIRHSMSLLPPRRVSLFSTSRLSDHHRAPFSVHQRLPICTATANSSLFTYARGNNHSTTPSPT